MGDTTQAISSEKIDWMEKMALENLAGKESTSEALTKSAGTTLTFLLAGLTGSMAYGIKVAGPGAGPVECGAAALAAWLAVLAGALVLTTLRLRRIPHAGNEPSGLLEEARAWTFDEMRLRHLMLFLQPRIEAWAASNNDRARWLQRVRLAALLSPAIFAAVAYRAA